MATRFCGLHIDTREDVFIPRPETELLVKRCLELMRGIDSPRVLDIGTGTGNIAVGLTNADETCKIVALDKSKEALRVARENAARLGLSERVAFIESDLFDNVAACHCERSARRVRSEAILFDIIVSNPPYIPTWEIETLAGHVKSEPRLALDGGEDGLDLYRKILEGAPGFLKKGGYLIMEMGYGQSYKIVKMLEDAGGFADIRTIKDSSNIERVIEARWIN
ncbi:MAG: peptide chain release factor N(5)-glutamine methyltransferase [Candidatus Omnitrophota bacterium]